MAIDFEVADHIATITINRPERLNALDQEHYEALSRAWMEVRDNPEIRVAIVTGAGERAFSAGADLKTYDPASREWSTFWTTQRDALLNRGLEVWKPVIAAINGYCVGGGLTLTLATDIRVAVPEAHFGLSEVKRGIIAANGGTQRLIRQVPHAIAMEMLLCGDMVDAETALRWGLINRIVEAPDLMDAATEYARQIARNAPLAVQASKELAVRGQDLDLVAGLRLEQMSARLLRETADAKEGPMAFAEKRLPNFEGR
ncbi:enoyl-CoA hydratase/isomerase family protein [Amorphus sp. 3PC139-8]|uniref:enoyl-CoA hydratase/isomerase family protein n=1 Tax=Amorphus sp. 3PC139-8 TaxID=2735676 RepID=UPI00345CC6A9